MAVLGGTAMAVDEYTLLEMKDAQAYHERGYEAQVQGNLRQAQFLYERAKSLDPNDPGILNDLGLVYEALGMSVPAEAQYLKAIEIDFKCLPAYSNLGHFYRDQGMYDKAIRYFESRVRLGSPGDKWTLEAQESINEMMRTSPTLRKKRIEKDKESLENTMTLRARERVRVDGRDQQVNAEMDYLRGLMFFGSRQYEAAAKSFEACLKQEPLHKKAGHMLARARTMPSVSVAVKQSPVDPKEIAYSKSQRFKDDPVNSLAVKELEASARQDMSRRAVRRAIERANTVEFPRTIVKQVPVNTDDPEHVAAVEYAKGIRLMQDGYMAEAVKAFDRALVFVPYDADILAARRKALGN